MRLWILYVLAASILKQLHSIFCPAQLSSVRSALMKDRSLIDPSISQLNEVALPSCSFKLNNVKINFRCSLVAKRLDNILRIMEEGSSWETFDPVSTIKKKGLIKLGAQPR